MEYVSPNMEVTLVSEDGATRHKFVTHKKYMFDGDNGITAFVKTKQHGDVRFTYDVVRHGGNWSDTTGSDCKVG